MLCKIDTDVLIVELGEHSELMNTDKYNSGLLESI